MEHHVIGDPLPDYLGINISPWSKYIDLYIIRLVPFYNRKSQQTSKKLTAIVSTLHQVDALTEFKKNAFLINKTCKLTVSVCEHDIHKCTKKNL